ncbi:hypothetical protein F2Q70_00023271 [Brassica cretica]|uniref:CG-1 domain-containing protein n=1 Tax=Brassica cretica TaxID=69181 RepID=A0A8S9GM86_BRACR|nr:hypothetical protein F2Q70_00023271 [Brassica cretica]
MDGDGSSGRLIGSEIHGFHTLQDLDVQTMLEEARSRWLRPNEIHAVLSNPKYFTINVKPVNLPTSGRIILFDRKMLRNFRKDGHNWKKKKDGRTVKEAHEHLKVGDEERIHVYYAHGEDNTTFVRRCYWLLDKARENIVLVHYRDTQEAATTSGDSNSPSAHSSSNLVAVEDVELNPNDSLYLAINNTPVVKTHETRLHDINTLDWDELLVQSDLDNQSAPIVGKLFEYYYQHLGSSNLFCICGDSCVPAEYVQAGVYRCFIPPHSPGMANLYLSADGHEPISQCFNFEHRPAPVSAKPVHENNQESKWEEFELQVRLAHLLFTSSNKLNVLSSNISPENFLDAKKLSNKTSHLLNSWAYLIKSVQGSKVSFDQAKDQIFELTLKNRVKEWLMEKVLEGRNARDYDSKGLGVIHLCAILGYTWSIQLFSLSGLSLDFRDKQGWTALHWAAYYGREKMVAALLTAGAKPNLVTDSRKDNLGGCTPADLAQQNGFDGIAAYLAEKCLVAQFVAMKLAGNISGTLETCKGEMSNQGPLPDDEQNLKDALAAYRTAAEAAARIQGAFREKALKTARKLLTAIRRNSDGCKAVRRNTVDDLSYFKEQLQNATNDSLERVFKELHPHFLSLASNTNTYAVHVLKKMLDGAAVSLYIQPPWTCGPPTPSHGRICCCGACIPSGQCSTKTRTPWRTVLNRASVIQTLELNFREKYCSKAENADVFKEHFLNLACNCHALKKMFGEVSKQQLLA